MVEAPDDRPSITRVWARNFRSIEYAELELGPLTVLAGPNASGKSNLMDVLTFLGDVVRLGLKTAIIRRGGIDSISRRSPSGRVLSPGVGFRYASSGGTVDYALSIARGLGGDFWSERESVSVQASDPSVRTLEFAFANGRLVKPNLVKALGHSGSGDARLDERVTQFVDTVVPRAALREAPLMYSESLLLLFLLPLLDEFASHAERTGATLDPESMAGALQETLASDQNLSTAYMLTGVHIDAQAYLNLTGLYHIFPNSLREPRKVADSYPLTTDGDNLASTLRDMIGNESRFLPDLKNALEFAVPGVTDIRVRQAGSYYVVELQHEGDRGNGKGSWFDLSYESDGTIRLLAMLTALSQDPAPSVVGLEEPELAIHPGAMAVLSDAMKETATRGQVLVATHSPDLIDRLPIESIRAVTAEGGSTRVDRVAEHQLKSVRENLFSAGEIHSMEGLQPADAE